ncbi:MAG: sulfatase-like hydrolase/transferase [Bacteroidetes bacterium]|nr:sulfatase-like hydrolase/transferase [Bacteroidota bacterium]
MKPINSRVFNFSPKVMVGIILLLFLLIACKTANKSQRPNILFILTDDQGYGDFSCFGNNIVNTPNIDNLYEESTCFTHYTMNTVCAPTRASLMTGRYNYRVGVWDTWHGGVNMRTEEVTIAEALRNAGYHTGFFGKWHLGYDYPFRPIDQGFTETFEWDVFPDGNWGSRVDPYMKKNGEPGVQHQGFLTDLIIENAIEYIEAQSKTGQPFFAYVATFLPHIWGGIQVPEKYIEPFRENDTLIDYNREIYGMVEKTDECIGRLLQKLKELGIDENTVVIFSSDNGPQIWKQPRYNIGLRGAKTTSYEGGIRLPCFFRWPGQFEAGKSIDQMAAHIDMMPTILDICDVPYPAEVNFDGKSVLPLIKHNNAEWPERYIMGQFHRNIYFDQSQIWQNSFIRGQKYKLVNGKELFQINIDPYEENNIAETNPDIVKTLRSKYKDWFADVTSKTGFVTAPVIIGTPHQDIFTLNNIHKPPGGWPVIFITKGSYKITVGGLSEDISKGEATLSVKLNENIIKEACIKDFNDMIFDKVVVPKGKYILSVTIKENNGGEKKDEPGYNFVRIEK